MLLKKYFTCFLTLCLAFGFSSKARAVESKGISLGLSVATAITDEKNVSNGLKKVVHDETSTWLMSLIGGPDALFNEQINDISAVKGKIDEVIGIISSIEKISFAIGEGKYDVAAIEAMDKVVGKVNHPLVTLTWSAVKMTYESHLLVQSTKAGLEIETLYNVINKDRKMMGTIDPGSDSPPTIAMDKDATEYFFNKYVMTNDKVRQALKSYVTTVLGEQWPEQSWSDWIGSFRAIGTGLDTAKDAELAMLDKEWRDRGNSWVRRAIMDVNKKVKLEWARVRLSQAQAKFKRFASRVGHFYNGDFQQMLKEYMDIQMYKKELPMYIKALAESQKERPKVAAQISKLKPKDLSDAGGFQQVIGSWVGKVYSYSSRADMIRKKELGASLLGERQKWQNLSEKLDAFIGGQEGHIQSSVKSDAQDNEVQGISVRGLEADSEVASYRNKYANEIMGKYYLKEYEWGISLGDDKVLDAEGLEIKIPSGVEDFKAALLDQCNQANIDISKEMVKVWRRAAKRHFDEWSRTLGPVSGDIPPLESHLSAVETVTRAIASAKNAWVSYGKGANAIRKGQPECWGGTWRAFWECVGKNRREIGEYHKAGDHLRLALHEEEKKLGRITAGWGQATVQIQEVAKRMAIVGNYTYKKNIAGVGEIPDAFSKLRAVRIAQYSKFIAVLDPVFKITGLDGISKSLNDSYKSASEKEYTFFKPIKSDNPRVVSTPGVIKGKADEIVRESIRGDYVSMLSYYEEEGRGWTDTVNLWQQADKLDSEDIRQIKVFLKTDRDLEKDTQLVNKIAGTVPGAIAQIRNHYKQMIQLADRDGNNRAQDSGWLIENSRFVQRLINELIQKKWMKIGQMNELEVIFPGGIEDGMVRIAEPYSHYMTQQELDKMMQPIKAYVKTSKATAFMKKNTPDYYRKLQEILNLEGIKAAKNENFIVANRVVYSEDIETAENLINGMSATDKNFVDKMAKIAKWLPLTLNAMTDKELAYYKSQANLYKIPLEEYYKKVLGRTPSKKDYSFNYKIDLNADFLDKHELGKKYLELRQKVKELFAEQRSAKIIARQEANRKEQEKEIALRLKEENKKAEAKSKAMIDGMEAFELAGFYGYSIENPRLNSRSLKSARGDVILTKDDLSGGKMSISGRLFTIDKAETILLSQDGGRTWGELSLSKDINFDVDPLANKAYDFILRIKTVDGREPQIRIFNNISRIIYQNVNFEQLVAETVKNIAEAYEQTNLNRFSDHISRDYLGNKAVLEEGVRFDFDMFINIQLKIYINRISRRGNMFVAETKWDKKQTPRQTGEEQRTSGSTTFMFVLEDGKMRIKNLRGDLIYATLSPEIAQASGKSSTVVDSIRTARDTRNPEQPGAGETEDQGGVTPAGGGSTLLTIQTAVITSSPGLNRTEYIDFETGITGLGDSNGDINFGGAIFFATLDADIDQRGSGLATFNALDAVPGDFADDGNGAADVGNVFVILTDQGNYVKMYISNVVQYADPYDPVEQDYFDVTIKYAISTDGSTNLVTE